jgi:D-alanine-D-alanine ligase
MPRGQIGAMIESTLPMPLRINPADKRRLRLLLLAKHAEADGGLDAEDGNHAVYHAELRDSLRAAGFNLTVATSYEALFERPDTDFVIPLLNRGGFQNSEMLAPLLLERWGIAFLGARAIQRGWSDDKHLAKLAAVAAGVPTAAWQCFRVGQPLPLQLSFAAPRYIVKPNASSASWGVGIFDTQAEVLAHAATLLAQRQDVIVEQWLPALDVAVPVIGDARGAPWLLTPMAYRPEADQSLRSYEEKRGLKAVGDDPLEPVSDPLLLERLNAYTQALGRDYWPFDYGRFEFRHDPATGRLWFMEVNLSCNLWSRKTISRSARLNGIDHVTLCEHIVAASMVRQGLAQPAALHRAA